MRVLITGMAGFIGHARDEDVHSRLQILRRQACLGLLNSSLRRAAGKIKGTKGECPLPQC